MSRGQKHFNPAGYLHGPFQILLQPIHSSGDDPLDSVRDINIRNIPAQDKSIILLRDSAILKEGMGKLLPLLARAGLLPKAPQF